MSQNKSARPRQRASAANAWAGLLMAFCLARFPTHDDIEGFKQKRELENRADLVAYCEKLISKNIFAEKHQSSSYLDFELHNLYVSRCYSCGSYSVWVADRLIYPAQATSIQPNEDMPAEIRADFVEASTILDQSLRGAAALLRLCIQKLMAHLDLKGKNINDDIATLVARGLDGRMQKALDVVRVVGNDAVHPGQIDLRDDKATAVELFKLVNLIVEAMIATPKHIDAMYAALPERALKAIEKRDENENEKK